MAFLMADPDTISHVEPRGMPPWYVLRVRTNSEATSKLVLERKGYAVFLPTYLDCRRYSDRIKKVPAPLFPGYLFCRFDSGRRVPVLTTVGVESIIGIGGLPQAIEESEIEAIRRAVSCGVSVEPWPHLSAGDRVRIEFGSMAGVTGILVKARGTDRLILSVSLLQRSVAVEIDRTWIRPAEPGIPRRLVKAGKT